MKKFLRMFALALFVAVAGVALAACGGKSEPVTEEKVVGEWYVESHVYTYNGQKDTSTYKRFMELHNKADKTTDEEDEYADLETVILMFNATEEGELQFKHYFADAEEYADAGTWAIEDGKLTTEITILAGDKTVEYKKGKLIITQTRMWQEKLEKQVITLVRVPAEA